MGVFIVVLAVLVALGVAVLAAYEVWTARTRPVPVEAVPDAETAREVLTR